MTLWNGITEQGAVVPIQVDAQGRVVVSGGGGVPSEVYGAAKASGVINFDGSVQTSFNLSVSKGATGLYNCSFTTPLPDANYAVIATCAGLASRIISASSLTTTGFVAAAWSDSGSAIDSSFSVAVFNSYPSEVSPLILPTSTVAEVKALRAEIEKLKKAKTP